MHARSHPVLFHKLLDTRCSIVGFTRGSLVCPYFIAVGCQAQALALAVEEGCLYCVCGPSSLTTVAVMSGALLLAAMMGDRAGFSVCTNRVYGVSADRRVSIFCRGSIGLSPSDDVPERDLATNQGLHDSLRTRRHAQALFQAFDVIMYCRLAQS